VKSLPLHRRPLLLVGCLLAVCQGLAAAQTVADPDPLAASPSASDAASPRATVGPALVPHVPKAVSRPAGWPTSKPKGVDNHVLSSIRENPGAPLEPVRELIAAEVAKAVAPGASGDVGVVPAAFEQPAAGAATVPPAAQSLEMAMVVARVGPEVVLEGDLLTPKAFEYIEQVGPSMSPEDLRKLKLQICQQVLPQHVEMLLIYVDALREIPEDKIPEIRKNVDKAFDEQFLPKMMQEAGAANSLEYEQQLRAKGQSLDRMRKMFFERGLSQEWMRKNVKNDDEIPHADMIAYYQNHLADYDFPAQARFEALTIKIGAKRSRKQAWDVLASMGNEVLAGKPMADVARARSEGPTASQGGLFDWTNEGSLASKRLDEAVFSLPVGQLSAIIEDEPSPNLADQGALHIVRVVERKDAGRTPFLEAQVGIRETLVAERKRKATDDYLRKLRERTPVWSVFDGDPTGAARPMTASRPTTTR
jgi:parvulin-like peptidyl-prolyl isomerase